MVNFNDFAVIASDVAVLKKFLCLVDGFFIWEFMTTLGYEWNIIQERLRYRWTIWIYSLTRVATLVMVAINIFNVDTTSPINCQITMRFQFALAYLTIVFSSLLIVLRIIAIWDKNRIIIAVATGMWGTNIVFLIQGVCGFHATWGDENCVVTDLESIRLSTIVALVTDIVLLSIMLIGLSRMRRHGGGTMALGRLLWNQGVIWLVVAVVAELTPTVFICLDLNEPFNLVFQIPWVITMSIAATRMYRSLSEFLSSNISQKTLPTSGRTALKTDNTSMAHSQHSVPQADRSGLNMDEESLIKPHGPTVGPVGEHVETGAEK
ncbi:hypothetical protein F5888DRAFT_917715 [Russula emetica]|nr:hypothetical protein F5888DRAFT_917715 [Russula emetica]